MNFPTENTKYHEAKKKEAKVVDFAAIMTGKEEIPEVDTLDTALATFQSINNNKNKDNEKDDIKYSVKVTDTDKIKEVNIHTGKPNEKGDVVAELYKSETPSGEVIMDNLTEGKIRIKGSKRSTTRKENKGTYQKNRERRSLCRYKNRG